jgi:signal recognition particle GTPase
MYEKKEIMPLYRELLENGLRKVRERANHAGEDQEKIDTALREYGELFGIIDAMTTKEQEWPLDISLIRMHAIAEAAGASDQSMLLFVINFYDFAEKIARLKFIEQKRKSQD